MIRDIRVKVQQGPAVSGQLLIFTTGLVTKCASIGASIGDNDFGNALRISFRS